MKIKLLVIDPQNDFMDTKQAALPIAGAKSDMKRLSLMLDKNIDKIDSIYVTLDSHNKMQIFHPCFWQDKNGNEPAVFTTITYQDIKNKVYIPKNKNCTSDLLSGKSLYEHCLEYTKNLEEKGLYSLTIWPYHCLIGTHGHLIEDELLKSLLNWEENNLKAVEYIFKGSNFITEHYGALSAEYEIAKDKNTSLNKELLQKLINTDILLIAGQASSHCVASTLKQIVGNISQEDIAKIYILKDCMSPVLAPNNTPDFAKIVNNYLKELENKGANVVSSVNVFNKLF